MAARELTVMAPLQLPQPRPIDPQRIGQLVQGVDLTREDDVCLLAWRLGIEIGKRILERQDPTPGAWGLR